MAAPFMKIEQTPIKDLLLLHRPIRKDERGFFARIFGADELQDAGRPTEALHVNTATSFQAGTLRGIHFQYPPSAEAKIVSCASGALWDVGIDLRPNSPTRFQWFGTVLRPELGLSMIVPEGFGHAYITLEPNTTAVYVVSAIYAPQHESGVRFDDPVLSIEWPIKPVVISEKDLAWGNIDQRMHELDEGFRGF